MEKQVLIVVVMVVLLLISVVQSIQLASIKESPGVSIVQSSTPVQAGSASSDATLPSSLQNLPDMVGGC